MKKNYTFFVSILFILGIQNVSVSQCGNNRYHNFVFASHKLTSDITYGSNIKANNQSQTLKLDLYEPLGDTATLRPLIILAHGGSFVGGSKTGTDVVPLAKDFAKMGYVVASIEYRLGMTSFPIGVPDSTDAGPAVIRGMHDGKAAVRFFRKNADVGGNIYKIDTNNIYFAGVSAGGFIGLHMAYLDKWSEFPTFIDTVSQKGLGGTLEGKSGNPGYSSDVKAIINLCGALGDTAWVDAGDKPLLSMHGNQDGTVPYGSALIKLIGTYPIMQVDGSYSIAARATQLNMTHCFKTYWGQDHVPHVSNAQQYDTTIVFMRDFLEHFVCGTPLNCTYSTPVIPMVGVEEIISENNINLFPNPTNSSSIIDLSLFKGKPVTIQITDAVGRKVFEQNSVTTSNYQINKNNLNAGVYFITLLVDNKAYHKKIIFE